ncbi:putative xyloglucan endotransglucosylase/hydrolase protein 26 [Vitis vinifera]|uniref:Xyloglucan endotransglucosylase/hydrolase n=1 Tax=Vitis vinifera TaxID=29760 RepID=A0A438IHN2_VITVI|nr:putative xyloglucan endotransglucosylase/hydrolase protein 26 [Vitis vinifera]
MGSFQVLFVALLVTAVAFEQSFVDANFSKSMYFNWGASHSSILGNGDDLQLVLDSTSGSGVQTKRAFLFGSIEMLIKLVPGNSAGTVTAYYLSSTGSKHDEIDFEFLGNVSGQPYTIHTNIYTQGNGSREQQFYLWFDPTADFHNYTIHWNPTEVYIDSIPIRVFRNYENEGIAYPSKQARFRHFRARACKWNGPVSIDQCASKSPANWWTSPVYSQLSYAKKGQMKWVRDNHMIYDYCKDTKRFQGNMPPECFKPQF